MRKSGSAITVPDALLLGAATLGLLFGVSYFSEAAAVACGIAILGFAAYKLITT